MERWNTNRRTFLATIGTAVGVGLAGCGSRSSGGSGETDRTPASTQTGTQSQTDGPDWQTMELTDVLTDETFTIASLSTNPVVVEFFAVWCPVCTRQQRQMRALGERRDDVTLVSLNVDPNENAQTVSDHAQSKGFDWHYAVAPPEMTRQLVEEFGTTVTNPPAAPVIRRCPDGPATLLDGSGVKGVETLAAAVDEC